jgi:hypothetical protein
LYEITRELNLLPQELPTRDERQRAVLDLPGFPQNEILRRFNSFHYDVYKVYDNKSTIKSFIYYIMRYIGHNRFADLKIFVIRVLYFLKLYNLTKKANLLDVFQKG